ncbi:MAG: porin [Pseudomonadota bacterium]
MSTKHFPIGMAIVSALAAHASWAQTPKNSAEIYGRIDLSMDSRTNPTNSILSQTDNASRLGVKGSRATDSGLTLYYGLEMGVAADSGNLTSPNFRNAYVGAQTSLGKFAMGRLDSANPTGSPLYSQITRNISFVVHDAGATAVGTSVLNARNRTSNSIGYMSPTVGGFDVRARYYYFGNDGTSSVTSTGTTNVASPGTGLTESDLKQIDIGLNYNQKSWGLGIGYGSDSKAGGFATNDFTDKWQLVGSYDFGLLKWSALLGQDNYNNTTTARSAVRYQLMGVSVPVGSNGNVVANYMEREVQTDRNGKLTRLQMGYSHKIDKNALVYLLWDRQDPNTNVGKNEFSTLSTGIQINF